MSSPSSPARPPRRAAPAKVRLYAEFLGVDLDKHPYLYDLMEEGLRCPLPAGWKLRHLEPDEDGTPCHEFVHDDTGRTSNAHPMDEVFVERARALMRKHAIENSSSPSSSKQQQQQQKQRQQQPSVKKETGGGGALSGLVSKLIGSDESMDEDEQDQEHQQQQQEQRPRSAVASPPSGGGKKHFGGPYRPEKKQGKGRSFRYMLYCFVFAVLLHIVTYNTVFHLVLDLVENQKRDSKKAAGAVEGEVEVPKK